MGQSMRVIGLTGGIACGKSAVAEELRRLGVTVLDADGLAHELAEPGGSLFSLYLSHFGKGILAPDGRLDRKAIAERIYQSEQERAWIDRAAHPLLLREMRARLGACRDRGLELAVLEVPLLFEAGWDSLCHETWAVSLPQGLQRHKNLRS